MKLKINGINFDHFTVNNFAMKYNCLASTFGVSVPFDPDNLDHILFFKPLRFFDFEFSDNNDNLLLTGTCLNHDFSATAQAVELSITGYSKPGIINDSQIPVSKFPIQTINKTIADIAKNVCDAFGLGLVIDAIAQKDANTRYSLSESDPTQTAGDYLSDLCASRNLVLSHTTDGKVLITKLQANKKPIANITLSDPIITQIRLAVEGQRFHRTIDIIGQSEVDSEVISQSSQTNIMVDKDSLRSTVIEQKNGDGNQTDTTARQALANELRGVSITIDVRGWYINDKIPIPGDTLRVTAPQVYLFDPTYLVIQDVVLDADSQGEVMILSCVLPESFSGEKVQDIFDKTRQV